MEFLPSEKNGDRVYAGFWTRIGAAILDLLVLLPIMLVLNYVGDNSVSLSLIGVVASGLLFASYSLSFHYRFGATLGKMAVGIKVTLPDGYAIGIKHAFLRSSVDLAIALLLVTARAIAIVNADPEEYLSTLWLGRNEYLMPLLPSWHDAAAVASLLWIWSEFFVLLFNRRRRSIQDFMAGTVVIHRQFAQQRAAAATVRPVRQEADSGALSANAVKCPGRRQVPNPITRLFSGFASLITIGVLSIAFMIVVAWLYSLSPWLLIDDIDPEDVDHVSFFVAFTAADASGERLLHVMRPREIDVVANQHPGDFRDVQYHMEETYIVKQYEETSAEIYATAQRDGSQLVKVFYVGDTPWSSMSEYRMIDNRFIPLRHAHSSPWILLGIFFVPVVAVSAVRAIRRRIGKRVTHDAQIA